MKREAAGVGLAILVLLPMAWTAAEPATTSGTPHAPRTTHHASPTVGMEGRVEVTLPGPRLEARAPEHKSKILLRIAETRPRADGLWYDLRYIGHVPGRYDLRDWLLRADGSATNDLPAIPVTIAPLLPEQHDGKLVELSASPFARLGGYRTVMIAAAILWAVLLVPLLWRRRRKVEPTAPTLVPPSLADRLRPLVEQAAHGRLSADGQAQLERLLLTHWRERLQLGDATLADAMQHLRQHPEAGELLRALESWLHRPPGAARVDVAAVLAPYGRQPAS